MSPARRSASAVVVALAVALGAAGCSKAIANVPAPGSVVRQQGSIGKAVDYYGLQLAVLNIQSTSQTPDGFPRLLVAIRSENKRVATGQNPDVGIRCDESNSQGDWFAASTWEPNSGIPGGVVSEGQVSLSFPGKNGAPRYPVATCTHARVVVTGFNPENRDQQTFTSYPVDEATVQQAINAERGH